MAVPPDSGYPLKWFKNQEFVRDHYECVVCLEVVKDPVQVRDCGHLFCKHCLDNVLKLQKQCPSCRIEISEEMLFHDKNASRSICKLEVNCPSTRCEWNGNLSSFLQEHTARCRFFVLNCSNDGCDIQLIRQEMEVHLAQCEHRTVVCEHCNGEHMFMDKDKHLSTCPKLPVECINQCPKKNIPCNEMDKHLDTDCPKTLIKCKYLEFGCEYECQRQKMEEHLNEVTKEHLDLASLEVSRLKKQDILHHKEICELRTEIATKVIPTTPPIVIITDFKRKLSEVCIIEGDPFYSSPHGYKLKLSVQLNDTRVEYKDHMGVYIYVMRSDHDAILSWPFKQKCTITLIDQQDNEGERKNIARTLTPKGEDQFKRNKDKEYEGRGFAKFVPHKTLLTRKYIKDDTVFLTLRIEP